MADTFMLNKRQEWMVTKLQQCFGVTTDVAEKCIRDYRKKIDAFLLDGKSPPKLFFFHQPRQFKVPELFLSVGGGGSGATGGAGGAGAGAEGEKLEGKCMYFLRDVPKPVNVKVAQDATVLAGEIGADILTTFEQSLQHVYGPLLHRQGPGVQEALWGGIRREKDRKQFLDQVTKFDEELKRKIANLRGDVELRTPAAPFDKIEQKPASYAKAAKDKNVLDHFQDIVASWCEQITKYMEDDQSNTPLQAGNEKGPDEEIEYWCRRMLTLISITEQLKSKPNRVVTGVLKARALRNDEGAAPALDANKDASNDGPVNGGGVGSALSEQEQIKNLIERWREVDLAITDALNEAKDNVRFLDNLRKVIEPLYTDSPTAIADTMPALMNSMKMIHTLSRHYGTETRMTNLFQRITNQLITRCKEDIYAGESVPALWQQEPESIIAKMNASIKLLDEYRRHYKDTKARLATMPKGKQFNFDETAIFGKFVRFRRRLEKLIDMFSSIQQFKALERKRIDGMEELIASFDTLVNEFKLKGHDLLDFNNTVFERDFVEFTMHNSGLENAIQDFMERSLTQMSSIDKQLELMRKFQSVLQRDALKEDLEHKYLMIFKLYGEDLHNIQALYEKHKDSPPIPRNMTRIAGNIHWSRQLLRRITSPMKKFQENPKVFFPRDSKKIVRHYNKLARTLIEFESLWFQAWERSTDTAKKGLRAKLIVQDTPANGNKLYVNFDHGVLQLMREAKHLSLMGFDIPNSARVVLLLEDKLKSYYNHICHALNCYNKIIAAVPSVCRALLRPHLLDLEKAIAPARTTMTWTSMNIDSFITALHTVLARFEYLVSQINDIIHNRVQKNLNLVANMFLLNIPLGRTFTLRDFVALQRQHLEACTEILLAKNEEIERAVDDLVDAVCLYPLDPSISKAPQFDVNLVKLHYCHNMYHALLTATKRSLNELKKRVSETGTGGGILVDEAGAEAAAATAGGAAGEKKPKPAADEDGAAPVTLSTALFEVDLSLQVPKVTLSPSLDEVQDAINAVARDVLQCTRKLIDWGIDPTASSGKRPRRSFYDRLASDKNLAIVLLLLTGAVEETKVRAQGHLSKYDSFAWLWQKDPESVYKEFLAAQSPILEDFIAELHKFVAVEQEIAEFPSVEQLGCLHLKTDNLKAAFKHETERWKFQYSEKLHQEAKADMDAVTEQMHDLKSKLERDVKDFASLKFVMDAQAEIRDVQSWIDSKFESIVERYNTLEKYLPFGVMTKDEMDTKSVLRTQWTQILGMSSQVMSNVNGLQGGFKQDLMDNVRIFKADVKRFRADYDLNGPMARSADPNDPNGKSIPPLEAMTRLNKYKREFETLNRKYELFNGGEKLFGLPEQKYPDLVRTRKELRLLDQLYTLYQQVISTVDEYKAIPWSEVMANIQQMNETVEAFNQRCRHLPRGLKSWEAYLELSQTIEDFIEILPLLTELSKPAMRDRHWKKISKLTGKEFELEKFHELKLRSVLEANLLEYREDIEEITDGAEKQLAIEKKIMEIQALWDVQQFEFAAWKDRGDVILAGSSVADITEQLEDSQASLIQMLTQRHVTPFRDQANTWLKKLSDVSDTLESWVKVQMLWMSLEAVFTGGDIARQMPQDTRVFMKVDKEWTTRLMNKAKDVKNVVDCCQNEYIKNMLPTMFIDLERCQKALDGYLEQKRLKFPRFYFVSNPALLLILSQGSDKDAVQQCFAKVFDAIDRVEFQGNNIIKIRSQSPGNDSEMDHEDIVLSKPVPAKGNIEDWLNMLLKEMRRTMKDIVRAGANDFEAMQWSDFIAKYCAQVTLLGVQFMWTSDVQEALIRTKHDKSALSGAFKKQTAVLTELSSMTTQDIKTKLDRTKIETLVTIQVHQRDVLQDLLPRGSNKERRVKDVYDFEWQRQLRCYWQPEDDDCVVKVADVDTNYCYEYLGCKERLVVTPLTDRCYVSLSQAIGMCFGGAPAGPAGTGKTETTKDLGRAYGKYVVVFNCSDQMHTADTAKIYKGLCQSGSWGCFDEFNRINLDVLSVVAQQVQAVLGAVRARVDNFVFPGDESGEVILDDRCGFFITMNPGYAGRQELPENLKALFRSCAMMIPDREIIIKVKLASVGYMDFAGLSKKFRVLYNLCEEQLSKQRHYDFGLRNILSVLRTGGVNLRVELLKDSQQDRSLLEEMLMMRTLRDMNLSKLVADDVDLFISLLHDLFPNQRDPEKRRYDAEEEAMRTVIDEKKLVHHDTWVNKIVQLYETSLVRHGLMMVGPAGSGKSMATKVLIDALTLTHDRHLLLRMNPKAIKAEEMFGQNDVISGEWTHGVFSSIWQKYNDPKKHHTWIVCDGPVDAIWIENLNSVLDDNKLLTLANGDRLPMTDNVRLLFEVQDLRNASPATVSRAGIIFVSASDLGTEPVVQAWLASRRDDEAAALRALYAKYIYSPPHVDLYNWCHRNVSNVMNVSNVHMITNLFNLMEGLLLDPENEQKVYKPEELERLFLYCIVWSLGSLLEADDRLKLSHHLSATAQQNFPAMDDGQSLYDFYVNDETLQWEHWEAPEWEYVPEKFKFSTCLIPTMDSVRAEFLIDTLMEKSRRPVLIVGSSGTAKTSIVLQYTNNFDASKMLLKKVNFSSATTAGMFQVSIEADIEKRQGKTFAPAGGRMMTCFLDDISMPECNSWGDQPTLEFVRQLIESQGFYFLEKDKRGDKKIVENILYIGAMSHPGGGRNDIPDRLKRHFFTFNMTPPSQQSIDNIYGSMLRGRFEDIPALASHVQAITSATIELWLSVKARMLPTPSKFHYIFNMRELSRVFQGVLFSPLDVVSKGQTLIALWKHECDRVFSDKLTSFKDKKWFEENLWRIMASRFGDQIVDDFKALKDPIYFVDFLRDEIIDEDTDEVLEDAPKIYERVPSVVALKQRVDDYLQKYNSQTGGVKPMNLVMFEDALEHMMRVSRIIGMPRGNALLVGVGGSGRQSLARLAAYIARQDVFQITITRTYKMADFLDDVRKLYVAVGKEGRKATWILTDFDIVHEEFLEYVNAILTTGEVAGLFPKDERDMMCSDLRGPARKEIHDFVDTPDNLYKYFLDRIRDNLHIVLCFSPANEKFAERARRFPGLIQCQIDWYLKWGNNALLAVASRFVSEDKDRDKVGGFRVECDPKVEKKLVVHIATVHDLVTDACEEYFQRYRRNVFVTPKSYLAYISSYKQVYKAKLEQIAQQQRNVETGLKKLKEAEVDVVRLQDVLAHQNVELGVAEKAATAMLAKLEVGAKEAGVKKAAADAIEVKCTRTANQIAEEQAQANTELEQAMPYVRAAEKAARSINKKDLTVIQKLGKPPDLIKRIMDCVLILNHRPLDKVSVTEIKVGKTEFQLFVMDSYDTYAKKMMIENGFLTTLLDFAVKEKDNINEETMELLEPYLKVSDFHPERARTVSSAAEGLCKWVMAMASYHEASLVVGPKLEQLKMKTMMFDAASLKLRAAKAASKAAQDEVDKLQEAFTNTMKEKAALEEQARLTQEKMVAANNLIRSLAGEKKRWQADALIFAEDKKKLVGNVALACAFLSYLGPFNYDFRQRLMEQYFLKDCLNSGIPVSKDLDLNKFLVDDATIAEWNSQGLPKDDLSIQNAMLVTSASRFPLLVDPQGQALAWLKKREANDMPIFGPTTINNPKIRDQLEFALENGKPLLVEGVTKDVDPAFDPVLEKNVITRGRTQYIMLGEKQVQFDPAFRLYLITKLSNPKFSPELCAKTTIIDFSVTQKGLEEQLLSRVIQQEQKSLEDQRQKLIEEVNQNTISLQALDKQLLERLSASQGNLLDDTALIGVLADTKTKAQEVKEKIEASVATEAIINKRREHYRPVACRGSVIYFVIVSMAAVNPMYQSSLAQFLQWFDASLQDAEKANLVAKRVENLMKHLTYEVYININRGLFEVDKLTFKLMTTLKVLQTEPDSFLDQQMITILLRGGAALSLDQVPRKPFDWLQMNAWFNICQLSSSLDFFGDLKTAVEQNEGEWKRWYEAEAPETLVVPRLEDRLASHPSGPFMRFLIVRSFRDDRTRLAANQFISTVLGPRYIDPAPTRLDEIHAVSDNRTPVVLLLTPGADPTSQLEELAKKKGVKIYAVSMGEGQEPHARKSMEQGMEEGAWSLLQNCHLGLGFMGKIEEDLIKYHAETTVSPEFRLWITCEPHIDFPINLLQISIKVTNEPPRGMKAGLLRSYSSVVDGERLGRVETKEWRDLVYTLCFLHSVVQERRKFGPVGWAIPYEFNTSDLEASLTFLEKHCFANQGLSWPTVRYMICQVQYGGRITDDFDRVLFDTFGKEWLGPDIFKDEFQFTRHASAKGVFRYGIPACETIEAYRQHITELPNHDSPELFGLHVNADLTFGTNEALYILNTISETQPKETAVAKGAKTREETVFDKADELLALMPKSYKDDEVRENIRKRSRLENEFVLGYKPEERVDGFSIPLNIFLYQEITRLNRTINNVKQTLLDLKSAINGEIIMTPELQAALNDVYNEKPPKHWYLDASGSAIAWYLPSLALWFAGLLDREKQLSQWLNNTRPVTYWMTGFFNPQGFLTATRQEVTRRHKNEKWALDDVVLVSTVTEHLDLRRLKMPPSEGVYIHGLYLEGCSWDKKDGKLVESHPKELYTPMPVMLVTAVTSKQAEKQYAARDEVKYYDCPVYRQPKRTDLAYIFSVKLKTYQEPDHWVLRGVALLCSKD